MPWIDTHKLTPESVEHFSSNDKLQVYNGLDACVTLEVFEALQNLFNEEPLIYNFERALQGPILEIMLRGFLVDEYERQQGIAKLSEEIKRLEFVLNSYAGAVWGKQLNPRSHPQMKAFFYGAMQIPEIWVSDKGVRKLSFKREVLEKLENYFYAMPIIACILAMRDRLKQREILLTEVDSDGRLRTSYNIAGTETGRLSSSSNAFGTGGNLQNIPPELRRMFIADHGKKLCSIDLEQAEARELGFQIGVLFNDWTYLDNCECLTTEHEVLTPNGWASIATKPSSILTYNNGASRFEAPLSWNEGVTDTILEFAGKKLSLACTKDHKMGNGNSAAKSFSMVVENMPITSEITNPLIEDNISVDEAQFIAAYQCDGTTDSTGKTHFTFVKQRKITRMEQILKKLQIKYSIYDLGSGATRFYLHIENRILRRINKIPGSYMLSWSKEALYKYVTELEFWDGHREANDNSHYRITSKSKSFCEWVITFAHLVGKSGSVNTHKGSYWVATVSDKKIAQTRYCKRTKREGFFKVYCPTVASRYFMVRHKGVISITGNSGDLHTANAKLVWPKLAWTGDKKKDREIADSPFYRDFSYRDMSKRGGHATNYYGQPFTVARNLKVPVGLIKDFQLIYFTTFPGITKFHQWTAQQLQTNGHLTTAFGRQRHFYGRPGDDTTLREAIAYMGQSPTADRTNLGLYKHWDYFKTRTQLLAQTHDSITFQYDPKDEAEIIPIALKLVEIDLFHQGRKFTIPGEAKIGWNWAACVTQAQVDKVKLENASRPANQQKKIPRLNPDGLIKFSSTNPDTRQRHTGLTRVL